MSKFSKFLIVGDPHIKPGNLEQAEELFRLVESFNMPVIWLGDLLDTKELIRGKCLNAFYKYFKRSICSHFVLVGNHDWFNLDCREHSLELLKELQNVKVVDEPFRIVFNGHSTLMLPYYHDLTLLRNELGRDILEEGSEILIMHQGVNSFDFGNGFLETQGLELKELSAFKKVISGHFHKYQERENLIYPGTPFTQSQGEANQTKYLMVFDMETLERNLIITPFPKHITFDIFVDREDEATLAKTMEFLGNKNHVRVILHGSKENLIKFNKSKFESVRFVERESNETFETNALNETQSNEEKFTIWATQTKLDPATMNLGIEILKGAQ